MATISAAVNVVLVVELKVDVVLVVVLEVDVVLVVEVTVATRGGVTYFSFRLVKS